MNMSMPATAQPDYPGRILVIRLGSMGDVIHTLPAAATLKHSFPAASLCWAIDPRWACLLEDNTFVDEIIPLDRRSLRGILESFRRLRVGKFSLVVDFQGLIKSALAASVARASCIYGFHQSQAREPLAALFYSHRVKTQAAHVVDRNLELASATGASAVVKAFPIPAGTAEGELPGEDFVLASPLAGWPAKQWPLENYVRLATLLKQRLGLPLVLNGAPGAAPLLNSLPGVRIHLSSIPGLIHATRRALAVVGIDSGPLHLAAALQKPGVALYGPTDPARNGPYGGSFTVIRSPEAVTSYKRGRQISPSMQAIPPELVFEAVEDRIAGFGRRAFANK